MAGLNPAQQLLEWKLVKLNLQKLVGALLKIWGDSAMQWLQLLIETTLHTKKLLMLPWVMLLMLLTHF